MCGRARIFNRSLPSISATIDSTDVTNLRKLSRISKLAFKGSGGGVLPSSKYTSALTSLTIENRLTGTIPVHNFYFVL